MAAVKWIGEMYSHSESNNKKSIEAVLDVIRHQFSKGQANLENSCKSVVQLLVPGK